MFKKFKEFKKGLKRESLKSLIVGEVYLPDFGAHVLFN